MDGGSADAGEDELTCVRPIPIPSPSPTEQGFGERRELPIGVRGGAPAESGFGALQSCQKAAGSNHFEYSEVHVLQQIDQLSGCFDPPHNLVYGTELFEAKKY